MRKTLGKFVPRASAFALTCLALAGTDALAAAVVDSSAAAQGDTKVSGTVKTTTTAAEASSVAPKTVEVGAKHTYSSSGTVGADGITGTNVISFNPVASGSFAAPSSVGLGEFVVSTLPEGSQTTYNNTHFSATYNPVSVSGITLPAGTTPVTITGVLNGTISGNQSSVKATFDPIASPVFSASEGLYLSTLSVLNNPLDLTPASAGGRTTIQAKVVTTSPSSDGTGTKVPEPTTFALLATSLVGLGLRQRLRARKSA